MLAKTDPAWERYESAARDILQRLRGELGFSEVQCKQDVQGVSGTTWEIDAKGVVEGSSAFFLIECRRYTKSKLKQEHLAALAWRVQDTGASGALAVSPLGWQEGAAKVAAASNVHEVRLSADSTLEQFVVSFLGTLYASMRGTETKAETGNVNPMINVKLRSNRNAG